MDDGSYAAAYASKWGLESEMTKGHAKKGKHDSMTPWDMLRCYLATKCERSRKRFMVYIEAFTGRRQLYWSNGLKAKLGVGEVSDEELVHEQKEDAGVLAELTDEQWAGAVRGRFYRPIKQQITARLDADVLAWLKAGGQGYQTRMNAILRRAMMAELDRHS